MRRLQTILTVWLLLLGAAKPVYAQFHTMGADPGGLRWSQIETPTYRVVYPRGLDSLARAYAQTLEQAATPVGGSIGIRPNAAYGNKMPVVLHVWTAYSNGQVTWTPRRMELLTVPDAFPDETTPWMRQLGIHESRHVAQMQAGAMKPFRWLNVLGGQLIPGGIAAIYGGPAFFEGDAVVAETALSISGRGRSADFLEYYRVSFAAGDTRDFWRWRYGSQRWYTPDYYRAGYLAVGGIRATFEVPDLSARFYQRIADHGGVAFFNWNKTVREATGLRFKDAFAAVCDTLQQFWAADELARGPFLQTEAVTAVPRRFTEYTGLDHQGNHIYAIQSGITQPDRLVRIYPDGTVEPHMLVGTHVSGPESGGPLGKTYWSEVVRDARWPLRSYSIIRSFDGKYARKLTRKTRYFNPVPAPHESVLSVTEYPVDGTSRVVLLDAENGSRLRDWQAPEGMQVVETIWVDDVLYASAITEAGAGLYRVADGFTPVLGPTPVNIGALWAQDDRLMFSSDLTGVQELYALDPAAGRVERLTNLRFGGMDFDLEADSLYFSVLQPEGRLVHKVAWSDLQPEEADFTQLPKYPFAEELAAGEPQAIDWTAPVELSEPKPYSKLGHLFRFHSWLPFYFHYDSVDDLSFEKLTQDAGLGATAFWQNDLGSGYGFAGYHAAPVDGVWRHSLHANFTYTGLYPVIEASVDFGERDANEYILEEDQEQQVIRLRAQGLGIPSVSGSLKTYIPWNFTSGGWQRGLVPTAALLWSTDRFMDGRSMNRTTMSLRGYIMESSTDSRVYPRLGIGAELGVSFRWIPGLISPSAFGYLYGYLPGLHETHGVRWSALYSRSFDGDFSESFANTAPRGFSASVTRWMASYPTQVRCALDYKLPLIPVDRAILGPVAYLRNFELTLHGDYTAFSSRREKGALFSAGADLTAVLGNLLWVPYPTRIGVSYNYNGGPSYEKLVAKELPVQRHSFSLVFSVEM
ncbi:MAG: hypothetical protein IKN00_07105 [Bacteroidales bacterium]|nr:hypothetical protein [Bacteroidales bacterium]MBR6876042.1 hypothetical protein [Bacteroidales bacterium]